MYTDQAAEIFPAPLFQATIKTACDLSVEEGESESLEGTRVSK
jgi:hypothetical protein